MSYNQKPKIVVIGGGTGSYTVLRGLKKYPLDLSAVVAMTDDGGSSGILRDELGVLPPGDIRQCLVALSESSEIMRDIFNYRFSRGLIKGHSLGNLLISALERMKGSLKEALPHLNKLLALRGEVVPVTFDKVRLLAELENGQIIFGENRINRSKNIKKYHLKRLFIQPKAKANPRALEVISEADVIVMGPGNLYCSLLPHFLVPGITKALKKCKAKIIYNVNLMTKLGHTDRFSIFDFVDTIEKYLGKNVINYVLFNTKKPPEAILKRYSSEGKMTAIPTKSRFKKNNKNFIGKNLISNNIYIRKQGDLLKRSLVRHDSDKLAQLILDVIKK